MEPGGNVRFFEFTTNLTPNLLEEIKQPYPHDLFAVLTHGVEHATIRRNKIIVQNKGM